MNDYKYLVDLEDVSTGYDDLRIEEVKIKNISIRTNESSLHLLLEGKDNQYTKDFKLVDLEFLCEFIEGIVGVFSLKGCFGKKVRLLINENLPIAMGSTDSDCWV